MNHLFKVIIAGSRRLTDYKTVESYCDHILSRKRLENLQIVSGGCSGADALGERYAKTRGISLKIFPADFENLGKSAGPRRNIRMAEYADALIAFSDGKSAGTAHMIRTMNRLNKFVRVKSV